MNFSKLPMVKKVELAILTVLVLGLLFMACDNRGTVYVNSQDNIAPAVPTGIRTVTMDREVRIYWNPVIMDPQYDNLGGYRVWRSTDNLQFTHIGTVGHDVTEYSDTDVINGTTYWYGVSSFNNNGVESKVSFDYETAFDTPRPEGFDDTLFSYLVPGYNLRSGFDFHAENRVPWDFTSCDFFLEYDTTSSIQTYFLWLGNNGAYIQDMGYTDSFDDITFAPNQGWSTFSYIEAILGHTYVIWTADNHYAKVRVKEFYVDPARSIVFDWGFQIAAGNRELKIAPPNGVTVGATNNNAVQ